VSEASAAVLRLLQHDPAKQTASLSAVLRGLDDLRAPLALLFGEVDALFLSGVQLRETPPNTAPGWEAVCLQGKARALGYTRDVYVELGVFQGEVDTVLILIPLPAKAWRLATGFPSLKALPDGADLRLRASWAVLSYAIGGVDGQRSVADRRLDLRGADLQDGLQFLSTGLVTASGDIDPTAWDVARRSGLPPELSLPAGGPPERVEVRVDAAGAWLQVEGWWPAGSGDFGEQALHAAGVGLRYGLGERPSRELRWLWEVGTPSAPVVLETVVEPGVPLLYTARLGAPAPLGPTAAALSALIGPGQVTLLPDAPADIDLISMSWAPGRRLSMVTAAGNRSAGATDHLLRVGPLELREVRYLVEAELRGARAFHVGVEARLALYGVDFGVDYSPGRFLQGGLADPAGVALGALLAEAVPFPLPLGLDSLRLRHAWLRHSCGDAPSTLLSLRLDGRVSLLPGDLLRLDSVCLEIAREDGGLSVDLGASFEIGPLVLRVQAAVERDGVILQGMGSFPNGLSLTELVDHLAHAFGAALPPEIPDVMVESVSLSFDSRARSLELQVVVPWTIADGVPVFAGDHTVFLTLTVARDANRGGFQSAIALRWTLEKGEHQLEVSALVSRDRQRLSASLSAPDAPLQLSDLVDELGLPALPAPAGGLLDFVFQASALSFDVSRPGNQVELAWARPAFDGIFLAELSHETGADRVKVCWLGTDPAATVGLIPLLDAMGAGEAVRVTHEVFDAVGIGDWLDDILALFTFRQLGLEWAHGGGGDQLVLLARSVHPALDRSFLCITTGAQPGVVAGVAFQAGAGLGDLPFLPPAVGELLDAVGDVLHLHPTQVLISTRAAGRFLPPGFSDGALQPGVGQAGAGARSTPFGRAAMPLGKGLALGMELRLGEGPDNPLRKLLRFDRLDAQLTVSAEEVGLQAAIPGDLQIDVGGGNSIVLGGPYLRVELGETGPAFDIGGSIDLMLFHRHLHAEGWLSVSTHSLDAHIGVFGIELPPAPCLPGVHFIATEEDPLWLDLGVQFAPPGLMMGLKGHFYIQLTDRRVEGDVTFVLEVVELLPQPLYVEFELDEMSIPVMLEAMTGAQWALMKADQLAHAASRLPADLGDAAALAGEGLDAVEGAISHINAILSEVSLDDVRIRWCDSVVNLPDGSVAMPGVGFRGRVSLFGWDAFAMLDFSSGGIPALTGHFEAEKISLGGVIEIWGDGKGIRRAPHSAADLQRTDAAGDAGAWFIEPGGPVLHVSTRSAPFLHADLHARLFGFLSADVHADVTEEGFSFDLHTSVGPLRWELCCHYWRDEGVFEASGSMGLHLHGDIGPIIPGIDATKIHLDTDLAARVELRVDSEGIALTLAGEFNFQGLRIDLPEVTLTVAFSSIEALAKAIWDHIVDLAEELFKDVILPIAQFFEDAAEAVAEVAVEAAEAVAAIATEAAEEVVAIGKAAIAGVTHAAEAVAAKAEEVLAAAGQVLGAAAEKAHAAAAPLHERAAALRSAGGSALEVAGQQVAALALDAAAYAEEALLIVADLANEAAQWVSARLDEARRWAEARLADAARAVARFAAEAAAVLAEVEHQIADLVNEIAELGRQIEHFFRDAAHEIEHFFVDDVGGAFKHAFSGW
jgi:hypothetical protein